MTRALRPARPSLCGPQVELMQLDRRLEVAALKMKLDRMRSPENSQSTVETVAPSLALSVEKWVVDHLHTLHTAVLSQVSDVRRELDGLSHAPRDALT